MPWLRQCRSESRRCSPRTSRWWPGLFAKLGLLNEDMMAAIAREVLRKIEDLDGQATANLVWAWAVLGLRHSWLLEPLMRRASVLMASLNGLEIANVAWGLSLLGLGPKLRGPWLQHAAGCFLETSASGASWVDFANVCKEPMEADPKSPKSPESSGGEMAAELVEGRLRERLLEPVLETLLGLQRAEVSAENFESQATKLGLRSLGPTYSVEALQALGFLDSAPDHGWVREARWQCRSVLREWQIPGVHSIVAYAKWKVLHPSGVECVLPGRVFVSEPQTQESLEEELGTWLKPFAACGRFAERMALLALLHSMSSTLDKQQLADFEGHVKVYLSHVPSLCTLGMLCQLRRPQSLQFLAFKRAREAQRPQAEPLPTTLRARCLRRCVAELLWPPALRFASVIAVPACWMPASARGVGRQFLVNMPLLHRQLRHGLLKKLRICDLARPLR